ncbi:TIGR01777 family oxidoreductase [Flavobacterium sp.]|uniref:TIGR01777 family oxidoreductase n=1 Tax=Flavobacterium sp. TaxID=239 RepID=UPI0008B2ECB8|nr:TIGR01777 family oxidoreductase [Flavobacterium sp.]OGS61898.1 MAG: TIGR01777 family protein [Flavobacteria bacterium GWF1_32_7]HBD27477.1 TIGR01777 family protein [Flavobacterium sp.]
MTVLITGATGLVGQELVNLLLQNGYTIHYLSTSKSKLVTNTNYKGFYWNPKKAEIDTNALTGVEVTIHLAGASVAKKWTTAYKEEIIESRVLSTQLLYKTLQKNSHQVKQIISASAVGIYPDSLTDIYHETDLDIDVSFLGNVVKQWENEVSQFEKLEITVSKIRIGLVLAKNGGALQEMAKPIQYGVGAAFGSGEQYQSWIHVQDLVAIFQFVMENQLAGVYNGVAPYPVTNSELIKAIAKTLRKPLFLPNIPKFVMKLILGEMHQILFSSQHVSCRKLLDENFQFKFASLDKALNDLLK